MILRCYMTDVHRRIHIIINIIAQCAANLIICVTYIFVIIIFCLGYLAPEQLEYASIKQLEKIKVY